jgi:putative ATP-dependent endonuclease of OLD family
VCTVSQFSGIKIVEVRIRNFRSLKEVDVQLDWLTVLIGENNAGKTSFLDALFAAIGVGRHNILPEDIYLAQSETKVPKDREVIIDLLILPTDSSGNIIDTFPDGSYWIELYGDGISQDDADGKEFVAIRTQMRWDATEGGYEIERKFLGDWQNPIRLDESKVQRSVSAYQIKPLALYLLDAKRDIKEEFQSRNSFWYKLISDLGLENDQIDVIEDALDRINEDIISGSGVLGHIQKHLNDLYKTIGGDRESVSITPIPRHLRDLSKGIDVNYSTKGAQSFPLARHGMGTRSLAAVLTFRAYMTWKQQIARDNDIHPILALEEPESHLHPQAQRALFKQIEDIPGQRIISTHSPYIVSQANITQCCHFRKIDENTTITKIDKNTLNPEDIRKIDRMVINTRGDLLYARALVFFEGDTEEQAFPVFAERYWRQQPNSLGITFIGVGGRNYLPFLRLAVNFGILWYIFSDGEEDTCKTLRNQLGQIGITDYTERPNIFILPEHHNFESYLVANMYGPAILAMLDKYHGTTSYLDDYITRMHGQRLNKTAKRDYKSSEGRERALCDVLSENKTRYGKPLAEEIISMSDESLRYPPLIRSLFEKMSDDLGLPRDEST